MEGAEILGDVAGTLTTISFLPQTIKVIRTRHTKDLALSTYLIYTIGIFLWDIYGIITSQWPVILSNTFGLPLCITILVMKIREKKS